MKYEYDSFYNVPIDMRHEADFLTREFGFYILYVRNNKYVKCRCFDDLNKCGNPKCKSCFGSGYFSSLQKFRVLTAANMEYRANNALLKEPIGETDQKDEIVYIEQQYNPKERDMVLVMTWDKNGYPVDIVKVLEVIGVRDMRGDSGRNELNGCIVEDRTDLVIEYQKRIKSLPRKVIAKVIEGGKGICPMMNTPH